MDAFLITDNEVLNQLQILNIFQPLGPDSVWPHIFLDTCISVAQVIHHPLAKLYNISLSNGTIPNS